MRQTRRLGRVLLSSINGDFLLGLDLVEEYLQTYKGANPIPFAPMTKHLPKAPFCNTIPVVEGRRRIITGTLGKEIFRQKRVLIEL